MQPHQKLVQQFYVESFPKVVFYDYRGVACLIEETGFASGNILRIGRHDQPMLITVPQAQGIAAYLEWFYRTGTIVGSREYGAH